MRQIVSLRILTKGHHKTNFFLLCLLSPVRFASRRSLEGVLLVALAFVLACAHLKRACHVFK